jgi:chromate reductase
MKKIVAFGASSSKNSINKELAKYAASRVPESKYEMVDLLDFEMPIYSEDRESEQGIPELAFKFKKILRDSDGIIISFAEHNGVYTAAFKNILDWISVIEKVVWYNKPMFLLATSNGERGAKTVLEIAHSRISLENPNEIPIFSLPKYNDNFDQLRGITDRELLDKFEHSLEIFIKNL